MPLNDPDSGVGGQRRTCDCGLALVATAEIVVGTPRRLWRCAARHELWQGDTDPQPAAATPPPPPGQMGLI